MHRRPHAVICGLLAVLLVVGGLAIAPQATATHDPMPICPKTGAKTLRGTVEGEDGRYLFAMIGLDLYDGNTPIHGTSPYDCYVWLNIDGTTGYGSPTSQGGKLTKNWSAAVPANTTHAFVELYVRTKGSRAESSVRYGKAKRERTPIGPTGRVFHLKAPLNCGARGDDGSYGDNGYLTGRVYNGGKPWGRPAGANIYTWSQHADSDNVILGWSIGTWRQDGTYVLPSLAPGQTYVTRLVLPDGRFHQKAWTPVNRCQPTYLDLEWGNENRQSRFSGGGWYLSNAFNGNPEWKPNYGATPGDMPLTGDWDGDGRDTIGIRRGEVFMLRNSNSAGSPDAQRRFGPLGGTPLAGDWDGDGKDSVGLWHDGFFTIATRMHPDSKILRFAFGNTGDQPVVGDWNGDGKDTIGVRRGTQFILRNANSGGRPDESFNFGARGTLPVVGDWNGDGKDTIGTYAEGGLWKLRNNLSGGEAHHELRLGTQRGDIPVTGDFDRDKRDTPGIFRSGLYG